MTSSNPLSYEGTKAVLQYMEANARFRISLHCRTLRKTEKVVPLKINSLQMYNHTSIYINDKEYKLGIIRKYPKGSVVPKFHQARNEMGGVTHDLDEYGIPKDYTEERIDQEIEIKRAFKEGASYYPVNEQFRIEFEELTNKRKKVLPPYTLLLRITALGVVEQYKYEFDLPTAHRQLVTFLFSGRREPTLVKNWILEMGTFGVFDEQVKFLVRNLGVGWGSQSLENVAHVIHNFPIESLSTDKNVDDLNHPLEKSARTLRTIFTFSEESLPIYARLPNENVDLDSSKYNNADSHVQLFRAVVQHWQEVSRKIGVTFTVRIVWAKYLEVLNQFYAGINALNGVMRDDNIFTIPLNFRSNINVELTPKNQNRATFRGCGVLKLSVVPL